MPVFNQLPKGIGSLKTLELPQTLDGQGILPDILLLSLELLILLVEIFLVGDGVAGTLDEIKKVVGGTFKKPKTSNKLDFPLPLAPTTTQKRGRFFISAWRKLLKFLMRRVSISMLGPLKNPAQFARLYDQSPARPQ